MNPPVLQEALDTVYNDRATDYGHPRENFRRIAKLWTAWLDIQYPDAGIEIDALDVAAMMTHVKQARLLEDVTKRDSWVDWAGYAQAGARAVGLDE